MGRLEIISASEGTDGFVGGAESPSFQLNLFGRFELVGPTGPVQLGSKKLCGLVAYLACSAPEPQPRTRLIRLFWGSHFAEQARQNLRQTLARLRSALGPDALSADGKLVSLRPDTLDCDVKAFEAAIREGSRPALAAAVERYRDGVLADLQVREPEWDSWVRGERKRLQTLLVGALVRLAAEEGDADRSVDLALRAVAIDPLCEDARRALMRAFAAVGRTGEALHDYERFAERVARDLASVQAAETTPVASTIGASLVRRGAAPALSAVGRGTPYGLNGWIPHAIAVAEPLLAADAYAMAIVHGPHAQAVAFAERAVEMFPNSAYAHNLCGQVYLHNGESDRAIAHFTRARRLQPRDPRGYQTLAGMCLAHLFAKRFAEAERWGRRAVAANPAWAAPHRYLAAALAHLGKSAEAQAEVQSLLRLQPSSSLARSRTSNFRHGWMLDIYLGGLQAAGLPPE